MATFGLVHGGFHGAWCWDRLIPLLAARGHAVVAMDLPSDDPDATTGDYVAAVVDALATIDEPVVLVGHSMGGTVIPHVPAFRPVARLVFVCPMTHLPGHDPATDPPDLSASLTDSSALSFDGQVTTITPEGAVASFYNDCAPEDAAWAVARLRPQGKAPATPWTEPWTTTPTSLIVCRDDRARNPEYLRRVVAPWLGVTPIEMIGDHSPFLSHPVELADVLDDLARA